MEIIKVKQLQEILTKSLQNDNSDCSDTTLIDLDNWHNLEGDFDKQADVSNILLVSLFNNESTCFIKIPKKWYLLLCSAGVYLPISMFSDIDLIAYWKFDDYSQNLKIMRFCENKKYDALSTELLFNSNVNQRISVGTRKEYSLDNGISFLPLNICTHAQILCSLSKKQLSLHNVIQNVDVKKIDRINDENKLKQLYDNDGFEVFINIVKLRDKIVQLINDKIINITNFNENHLIANIIKEDIENYCNWMLQITNIYDKKFENFINNIYFSKHFLLKKIRFNDNEFILKKYMQSLENSLLNERKSRSVRNLFCITIFNTIITMIIVKDEELKIVHSFNLLMIKDKSGNENINNMLKLLMFIELSRKNMMIELNSDCFIQSNQ